MTTVRPLGAKSSLLCHSFPSFYACYLLKSAQTLLSSATYIGSTPSPPRRIRQHNGELTQGARKTRSKRPWVMQMIVHGFPSRLAALQFEWAWQHPHKSRHFQDENGRIFGNRASIVLKKRISIVRTMMTKHPFNTWPLHVKLFTEEAVQHWTKSSASKDASPLPPGFTWSVELEGVDGQSGHAGSGRQGPISVDDADFTFAYLAKDTALVASGRNLECAICHKPVTNHSSEPLTTVLCPSSTCIAVSHLTCLSQHFLSEQPGATDIIPRGGNCKSCGKYTLWGDIVRGCYRRLPPAEGNGHPDVNLDDMFMSDEAEEDPTPKKKVVRKKSTSKASKRRKLAKGKGKEKISNKIPSSSEGETFDFSNIVSSSESEDTSPVKRRPGRPRKDLGMPSPGILPPVMSPKKRKSRGGQGVPSLKKQFHSQTPPHTEMEHTHSSSCESFDFNGLSDSAVSDEDFNVFLSKRGKKLHPVNCLPMHTDSPSPKPVAKLRHPGTPDAWQDDGLERAMSTLSVSTPSGSPFPATGEDMKVIVLSD